MDFYPCYFSVKVNAIWSEFVKDEEVDAIYLMHIYAWELKFPNFGMFYKLKIFWRDLFQCTNQGTHEQIGSYQFSYIWRHTNKHFIT